MFFDEMNRGGDLKKLFCNFVYVLSFISSIFVIIMVHIVARCRLGLFLRQPSMFS